MTLDGRLTDTIDMVSGGVVLNIEKGQWHSLKCLESGTVLFECLCGAQHMRRRMALMHLWSLVIF